MRHLQNRHVFAAPIERVFDLATDPHLFTSYMPWLSDVTDVNGRGDSVGDSLRYTDHVLGRAMSAVNVVTRVRRPVQQTTETTYANGSTVVMAMTFTSVNGGTEIATDVVYELGGGPLSRVLELVSGPYIARRLGRIPDGFRRLL